jgi:hypothetical protein
MMVSIFPFNRNRIRTDGLQVLDARFWANRDRHFKNSRIGYPIHLIMPAPAFSTWTSLPHQSKRISAEMTIVPGYAKDRPVAVCGNFSRAKSGCHCASLKDTIYPKSRTRKSFQKLRILDYLKKISHCPAIQCRVVRRF